MDAVKATFDPVTLIARVEELIANNQLRAARPLLAAVRRVVPPTPGLAQLSVRLSLCDGALEEAQRELDSAIQDAPEHPGLRKCRAGVRQRVGDLDGAARDAADAVILDRSDPGAKALLGALMMELGRPADAVACLEEASRACPDNALFREAFAASQEMSGHPDAALATLEDGLLRDPGSPILRNAAVLLCVKQRAFEYAVKLAEDARAAGMSDATLFGLQGHALSNLGRHSEAEAAYSAALRLEPADVNVRHLAAAARQAPTSGAGALDYLRTLFDGHAERFDQHLLSLGYRIPEAIAAIAASHPKIRGGGILETVLDLGCGTGLMGVAIRSLRIKHLIGVDLSAGMLEQAHEKGLYAALHQDDIVSFLKATGSGCDLALAADVLCYLGDLEPVFQAAFTKIHVGGWFIFSVESLLIDPSEGGTGWKRLLHGRHAHSDRYVEAVAQSTGFHVRAMTRRTVRYDGSIAVPGFVFLLERITQ